MNTPSINFHGADSNILLANEYAAKTDALDLALSKDLAEALNAQYPGHLWGVRVQGEQGIATIHNLMFSGEWGYVLRLDKTFSASELRKRAIRAGGEILERFKAVRGRLDDDAVASMPTDFSGRVLGDLSK